MSRDPVEDIKGRSAAMEEVRKNVRTFGPSGLCVAIDGETGTGKELVARALHDCSERKGQFVPRNCGAFPRDLLESELFGHKKGAFSGANESRAGAIRTADGGTLFLDEIQELPPKAQSNLLRVLEEREVRPVGSDLASPVDVRVVCASSIPLDELSSQGKLRADLLYRLKDVSIALPPLRDRLEDLEDLVQALLPRAIETTRLGWPGTVESEAYAQLGQHDWPGNVRELMSALKVLVVMATADQRDQITADDVSGWIGKNGRRSSSSAHHRSTAEPAGAADVLATLFDHLWPRQPSALRAASVGLAAEVARVLEEKGLGLDRVVRFQDRNQYPPHEIWLGFEATARAVALLLWREYEEDCAADLGALLVRLRLRNPLTGGRGQKTPQFWVKVQDLLAQHGNRRSPGSLSET